MARDTWFKCDPVAFIAGCEELETADQSNVYVQVCFKIYAVGGPVPNKPLQFRAATNLSSARIQIAIAQLVEMGKLKLVNGLLENPRASRELAERQALSEVRAKAGKSGGKASTKSSKTDTKVEQNSQVFEKNVQEMSQFRSENGSETRGNASNAEAIAYPYNEEDREKSPPHPQKQRGRFMPDMPDFGPDDRRPEPVAELVPIAAPAAPQPAALEPVPVNKPDLIAWIMTQAKMPVPPADMALVGGWVEMGLDVEREIKPTVCRMVAGARVPVRGMRYFDTELRTIYDVRIAKEASDRAGFAAIRQRYAG